MVSVVERFHWICSRTTNVLRNVQKSKWFPTLTSVDEFMTHLESRLEFTSKKLWIDISFHFMTLSPITPHLPNGINCARFSFILYQYLNQCCRPRNKICEIWFATKRFRKVHSPSKSTCNSLQLIKSFTSNFFEKVHPKWSGW